MLYFYEAIIGVILGVVLYFFEFLMNSIREKLNKPLSYSEVFLTPIISIFSVEIKDLISQYQNTKIERFMVVSLLVVMIISTILLLNKFVCEISVENIAKTKNQLKNQRLLLIAKWVNAIAFLYSFTLLIFWIFFNWGSLFKFIRLDFHFSIKQSSEILDIAENNEVNLGFSRLKYMYMLCKLTGNLNE